MWKMLDDLAVTDSAAYDEMVKAGAKEIVSICCLVYIPVGIGCSGGWLLPVVKLTAVLP